MAPENLEPLIEGILAQDPRSIARAISRVEDGSDTSIIQSIFPHTGRAQILGITGAPGSGKSTLVDNLAAHYRQCQLRVGIVAVDPTSPFTGGAILGDRIRMKTLGLDPGVFIRSMATRGNLGGLSRATSDTLSILDAAGYERLIVETVGVGQDEVDIVRTADISIVVLVPGMGDEVQAIKAGIMEIGDIFVINKADREGVIRTRKETEFLLSLSGRADGWQPPIVETVATEGRGIEDLAAAVDNFFQFTKNKSGPRRKEIARGRILEVLTERLRAEALADIRVAPLLDRLSVEVSEKRIDTYTAVDELLQIIDIKTKIFPS
jgi:LAO/AO transport system kinase